MIKSIIILCIFAFITSSCKDFGNKQKYKILDTINIGKLKDNEIIVCRVCRQDEVFDSEIIAIVIADDKDVFDRIVKAWRADTKTGRFTKIENLNKITCENEWYGV